MRKVFFLILLIILRFSLSAADEKKRPNIILFLSDDHGAEDTGCYGNKDLKTPVIDQLASEGIIFTHAFSPTSVSAPARSALFTGLYPHRNGCHKNHGSISPGILTLPHYIKPLGYKVVLAGKRHINPEEAFGFTYIDRDQIPQFLSKIDETPFCLIVSFNSPHQPYFNHKDGYVDIVPKQWLPDTQETIKYTAAYYDHVAILDHELGACLYWIERFGFSNAIQIYTSDHGAAFPFAKWTLYNQGIRVPLIIKWKDKILAGTENHTFISIVDILPTIVEMAGGNIPENIDGKSLLPVINNETNQLHDFIYATYTNIGVEGANEYPIRAILNSEFKLIVNLKWENGFHIKRMDAPDERALIDNFSILQSWMRKGSNTSAYKRAIYHWQRPFIELYDIKNDPNELRNISHKTRYSNTVKHLLSELTDWMAKQNDPFTEQLIKHIQNDK